MLKLGETTIRSVFLGEEKIRKVFLGSKLVYEGVKPSRLPEGYKELKYIQSGSGQYINTGIAGTAIYRLEMDVEPITTSSGTFFGASTYIASSNREVSCRKDGTTSIHLTVPVTTSPRTTYISKDTSNRRVSIVYDRINKQFSLDGETAAINMSATLYSVGYSVCLLYGYKDPTQASAASFTTLAAKLYSCKIYGTSSKLLRDFVPCVDPDGHVGMIDIVNEKMYYNGVFTAGPVV